MKIERRKSFSINVFRGLIFLPFSLAVLLIHDKFIYNDFIDPFPLQVTKTFTPVYFAVIVSDPTDLSNVQASYYSWGNKISTFSPNSIYKMYSPLKIKGLEKHTKKFEVSASTTIEFSKFLGFIKAAKDFLNQNQTDWFFRTTDLSFVNLPLFGRFANYIDSIFSPKDSLIMKGEIKTNDQFGVSYINGKSGYLMSRMVVEVALNNFKTFGADEMCSSEDLMMNELLEDLYEDVNPYSTKAMLGTTLTEKTIWRLNTGQYQNLTICREDDAYVRVRDIAVWATDDKNKTSLRNGRNIVNSAPENVFFKKVRGNKVVLCIGEDIIDPLWMDYEPYYG